MDDYERALAKLEEDRIEIRTLHAEIEGLTLYQDDLNRDFETVQTMLEERQSEVERLQQELLVVQMRLQTEFEAAMLKMQRKFTDQCNSVEERDEDLYMLNEAKTELTNRVKELETELERVRRYSFPVDVSDTASQTDGPSPLLSTSDSAVQVDFSTQSDCDDLQPKLKPLSITRNRKGSDTDGTSGDDLPFDDDFTDNEHVSVDVHLSPQSIDSLLNKSVPYLSCNSILKDANSPEVVKALVEHLHHESCRLLSLSLALAPPPSENGDSVCTERNKSDLDVLNGVNNSEVANSSLKSQALSRLVEANRLMKDLLEFISRPSVCSDVGMEDFSAKSPVLSNTLFQKLVDTLIADRRSNVSLLCNAAMEHVSRQRFPMRPFSGPQQKTSPSVGDFIRSLTVYVDSEDQKWAKLSLELSSDRQSLLDDINDFKKRETSLVDEVLHLSNQLSIREASLLEKTNAISLLSEQLVSSNNSFQVSQKRLQELEAEVVAHLSAVDLNRVLIEESTAKIALLEKTNVSLKLEMDRQTDKLSAAELQVQNANAELQQERNQCRLASEKVDKLETELNNIRSSPFLQNEVLLPNLSTVSSTIDGFDTQSQTDRKMESNWQAIVNRTSCQLANARKIAVNAEKMSRNLHACNQDLRISLAEAELRLIPTVLSGVKESSSHPRTSSTGSSRLYSPCRSILSVDSPSELKPLHESCLILLDLVADATNSMSAVASSSEEDSLNNPVELLRHAINFSSPNAVASQPSSPLPSGKAFEPNLVHKISRCLLSIESQVSDMLGVKVPSPTSAAFDRNDGFDYFVSSVFKAENTIMSGFSSLKSGLKNMNYSTESGRHMNPSSRFNEVSHKSIQCSLLPNLHDLQDSEQTVSIERFRIMSAKYLRMESYRRALVYQKRYLLLLLGEFRYSEQVVTASLGCGNLMGTSSRQQGSQPGAKWPLQTSPALVRFRAAARCVQVICRIKQLLSKWQRAGLRKQSAEPFPDATPQVRFSTGRPSFSNSSTHSPQQTTVYLSPHRTVTSSAFFDSGVGLSRNSIQLDHRDVPHEPISSSTLVPSQSTLVNRRQISETTAPSHHRRSRPFC